MASDLDAFFDGADLAFLERANGWQISRSEDLVFMKLTARDGERYRVRIGCDGYQPRPPSVAFVDDAGSVGTAQAWPTGAPTFLEVVKPPPNCFLCMPLTREGLQHHPDWIRQPGAWRAANSLNDLFNYLHRLLNGPDYTGRGG
jgi:hypothetical protein